MNQATIVEAVQEWLDARMADRARANVVMSVKQSSGYESNGFDVVLEECQKEDEPAKAAES